MCFDHKKLIFKALLLYNFDIENQEEHRGTPNISFYYKKTRLKFFFLFLDVFSSTFCGLIPHFIPERRIFDCVSRIGLLEFHSYWIHKLYTENLKQMTLR